MRPSSNNNQQKKPIGGRGTKQYAIKGTSKGKSQPLATTKAPRNPQPTPSPRTKSEIAKASATRVGRDIQSYCEETNEPILAKMLGGSSIKDNQPVDVVVFKGNAKAPVGPLEDHQYRSLLAKHGAMYGIEMKTVVSNKANKLTMKRSAMDLKRGWEQGAGVPIHTIVFDDSKVFNALGAGRHDVTKRRIFYRLGYGSFRIDKMHEVKGGTKELKKLLATKADDLPLGAK